MSEKLKFKLINVVDGKYVDPNRNFNAKNPLSAAKKAWRSNKYLDKIWIENLNNHEIHCFNANEWMCSNGKRKFKS